MDPGGPFFSLHLTLYIVIVFSQDIVLLYTISPFFKPVFVRVREKGHTLTWGRGIFGKLGEHIFSALSYFVAETPTMLIKGPIV